VGTDHCLLNAMQSISQKTILPPLRADEQVILKSQGAYKENFRSGWKVGQCFFTNQRFIIYQGPEIRLQLLLKDIIDLKVEKLHYVIRKKETLCLLHKAQERERKIWVVVNDLQKWKERIISQTSLLKVDHDTVAKIAAHLGGDSQDILWYLWENRYARIDELADLIDAPSHMHVLIEIRETINPVAEKMLGCPILSFERSKLDPETGEKVLFSWWLAGQPEERTRSEDRLLDIFDEGSHIQVIMEVRGMAISDLRLEVERNRLTVRIDKPDRPWKETIQLPVEVKVDDHQMRLRNNLLEIKLLKIEY